VCGAQLNRKLSWVPHPGGPKKSLKLINWATGNIGFKNVRADRLQARVVVYLIEKFEVM